MFSFQSNAAAFGRAAAIVGDGGHVTDHGDLQAGCLQGADSALTAGTGGHDFTCVDRGFKVNEPVQVVIRPEDVQIVPPSVGMLTGLVREVIFKGVHFEMHVDVEGYEWIIHSTQASQPGELIGMNIGPDEIHIMKRSEV